MKGLLRRSKNQLLKKLIAITIIIGSAAIPVGGSLFSISQAQGAAVLGCTVSPVNTWESYTFAPQSGTFVATMDAMPSAAATDALVGLSSGPAADYTDLAAIVRFSSASRMIDARNGSGYSAAQPLPYIAGEKYHFRMVINVPSRTYSAYVTPPGGTEKLIGSNYAFRTEQANVSSLNSWSPFSDIQSMEVCNFMVSGTAALSPDTQAPSVPQGVTAVEDSNTSMKISWKASTDNVGVGGYDLYQDGKLVIATRNLGTSYIVTGLVAPSVHSYTVSAYDMEGNVSGQSASATGAINAPTTLGTQLTGGGSYDQMVLADHPVAFWDLNPKTGTETDRTGNGNTGTYQNGLPSGAAMPNGDIAADFNGSSQYLTVPSNRSFSISTAGNLTWEAWVRPDTLQFPNGSSDSYVDFMGKCASYGPTCEWESRMYDSTTPQGRSDRFSAYVFNLSAGLGSGADWQPASSGMIQTGQWVHVVGEYTTQTQPSSCPNAGSYPGSIDIWVNGVKWSQASHSPTGCMGQYSVHPQSASSPLNIGTMALDYWFKGAIGKVAIYNYRLSQTQINNHYTAMTGKTPTGSCGATCAF